MEDLQLCVFKMFIKCHYKLSKMYIDIYFSKISKIEEKNSVSIKNM